MFVFIPSNAANTKLLGAIRSFGDSSNSMHASIVTEVVELTSAVMLFDNLINRAPIIALYSLQIIL